MIIPISQIPYLTQCPTDGRIQPLVTFYDEGTSKWITYIPHSEGQVFCLASVRMLSGLYLARQATDSTIDVEVPLLTFLFQRIPLEATFTAFEKLNADIQNSIGSLEKQKILFQKYKADGDIATSALVTTELEYALLNHRSAYDLLNRLVQVFLRHHVPAAGEIKDSFAQVANNSVAKLIRNHRFPGPFAHFYASHKDTFMAMRALRDHIAHHGATPDEVYCLPDGFGIASGSRISKGMKEAGIWESVSPRQDNDIGSCLAFLAFLAKDIQSALETFTQAFADSFETANGGLPPETAPGFKIYSRMWYGSHLARLDTILQNPWDSSFYES